MLELLTTTEVLLVGAFAGSAFTLAVQGVSMLVAKFLSARGVGQIRLPPESQAEQFEAE